MAAEHPIRIVAHRGLHENFPENSLQAFQAAWESGIGWAECDVHFSRDGVAIVLHDPTLDRTTTGIGRVSAQSASELGALRLRDARGLPTQYSLPTLESVMSAIPDHAGLLIEFKQPPAPDLLARLASRRVQYQSFDAADAPLFEASHPAGGFAWLLETAEQIEAAIASRWPSLHVNHEALSASAARRILAAGKALGVWTVNDGAAVRRAAKLGATTIITDDPQMARRELGM